MADPAEGEAELSPLDRVRLPEANLTRKVAAALEECEHTLTKAKAQAKLLMDEARQNGEREIISQAEEEARAVHAAADHQAEELRHRGSRRMDVAVLRVVNIITGMEDEEADK